MGKMILAVLTVAPIMGTFLPGTALAASSTTLEWVQPLHDLAENYQHSVAPSICAVMIAVFGMGVMFDQGGRFKQALNVALGTAIAVNVGGGLLAFGFGDLLSPSLSAGSAVPIYHVNITNDLKNFDLMSGFMNNFIQICKHGGVMLGGYAFQLMGLLLMIEMSVALSLGLINENKIQYLFAQILKIGIFVWLINNWVSGTYGIAHAIVASFEHLGYLAAGATAAYTPDSIVQNSINTVKVMWDSMKGLSMGSISLVLADIAIAIAVVLTTFLTAVEIFMARIEFWTVAMISVMLLPFAMTKYTMFLAEGAVRAMFSLGIKVAVVAFLQAVACPLLFSLTSGLTTADVKNQLAVLLQILLACIIIFMLVKKIPALVQGMISGSPSLVSGDFFDHTPSPAAAYAKYDVASNQMQGGSRDRKENGSTSWLGQSWGTAKNMASLTVQEYNPFSQSAQNSYHNYSRAAEYMERHNPKRKKGMGYDGDDDDD